MCGRVTLTRPNLESIGSELDVDPMEHRGFPVFEPHYNIAPSSLLPILIMRAGKRHLSPMYWGVTLGPKRNFVINLRAEAVPARPAFRERRCGVVTDGFFEWTAKAEGHQPYWFHRPDHALVVLAGLYHYEQTPAGFQESFAIITTRANRLMAPIHNRMPVVLDPARLNDWINISGAHEAAAKAMLAPAPDDWLVADPVSSKVNSVRNDSPDLLEVARS